MLGAPPKKQEQQAKPAQRFSGAQSTVKYPVDSCQVAVNSTTRVNCVSDCDPISLI